MVAYIDPSGLLIADSIVIRGAARQNCIFQIVGNYIMVLNQNHATATFYNSNDVSLMEGVRQYNRATDRIIKARRDAKRKSIIEINAPAGAKKAPGITRESLRL